MSKESRELAQFCAKYGFAVFPLSKGTKVPLKGSSGFKDATTDTDQIEKIWDEHPEYNLGIRTGQASGGLLVIDVDAKNEGEDGFETLREFQAEHGAFPETVTVITPSGGEHYYFHTNRKIKTDNHSLYPDVDIHGEGAYVVMPRSIIYAYDNKRYEWEAGYSPNEHPIAEANESVLLFADPQKEEKPHEKFELPDEISDGSRNDTLFRLACSLRARGEDEEAITAAVNDANEKHCKEPLSDGEIDSIVQSAMKYDPGEKSLSSSKGAASDKGLSLEMKSLSEVEEKEPEWLISGYIPRNQITTLVGDGGAGKTHCWCAIAAAISSGNRCFLEHSGPEEWMQREPAKVMFFSAEDAVESVLLPRLKANGANLDNMIFVDIEDTERFKRIKFNDPFFEKLLDKHRPALCVFDPIQAFIPPEVKMSERNAMRACMDPLIGFGKKYQTSFLIVVHTNKRAGAWGRNRMADSADIWDISRSVILAGETCEKGIRYLSHEKNNYGKTGDTILYKIADSVVFCGTTDKKDHDFVTERDYESRSAPARDEAKDFILEMLENGPREVCEIDDAAEACGISKATMKRAKADLKKDNKIKGYALGFGKEKKYFLSVPDRNEMSQ